MQEVVAYSSLALTMGLVLTRPRLGANIRVGPALAVIAGLALSLVLGHLAADVLIGAATRLWRPVVTMSAIMVMTSVAEAVGLLDRVSATIVRHAHGSALRFISLSFMVGAMFSMAFTNDSAVLLLTPPVVTAAQRLFSDRPGVTRAAAFAVFTSAGVAPLIISNPMNMIVASYAGLDFNAYAARMVPVAAASMLATFASLLFAFRGELDATAPSGGEPLSRPVARGQQKTVAITLTATLFTYPVGTHLGWPVFAIALIGAAAACLAARRTLTAAPGFFRRAIAWEVLLFLFGVFVLSDGLRAAGVVERLATLYRGMSTFEIGSWAALEAAFANNHPTTLLNMMALESLGRPSIEQMLAVMIGGDLGPRLLPTGSLAGLLWLESLRRLGHHVSATEFVRVGVMLTIPAVAAALAVLTR